jgi:DNA-binding transcriptional ArsR family regulator
MATDSIVVGAGAVRLARRVGPTAWTVLTALAVDAEPHGDGMTVRASVRSLAADLGLNKDTVGRALARLRQARLVVQVTGRFELGAYRLTVAPDVIRFHPDLPAHTGRERAGQRASSGVQLALLESE